MEIIKYRDLPGFDLYMDQTLEVVNSAILVIFDNEESKLTKTMINNYVKLKFLEKPVGKKYSRDHIAKLIVFAVLKNIATIDEVSKWVMPTTTWKTEGDAYDYFCQAMKASMNGDYTTEDSRERKLIKAATNTMAERLKLTALIGGSNDE